MTPRKGRGGRANNHNHNHHQNQNHSNNHHLTNFINYNHNNQYLAQFPMVPQQIPITNYDSMDNTYYYSDNPQQPSPPPAPPQAAEPSKLTNEELNISVLRRHNPAVTSILSLAPYVVVYTFNPATTQWEKNGIEGTMFICQLTQGSLGEERYSVFVLNRRGLNNFDILLTDGENVQITDEFVILKSEKEEHEKEEKVDEIIGLWIFSEPPPNSTAETRKINAEVIKECATHAGKSLELAKESLAAAQQQQQQHHHQQSVPMGRQISLKELFGQQRAQDDAFGQPYLGTDMSAEAAMMNGAGAGGMNWSHNPAVQAPVVPSPGQLPSAAAQVMNQPGPNVLTDLFRRAGLVDQN